MKKGWEIKTIGEILQKTETINPLLSPNKEFNYIDVSSVSNKTFQIETTQRLKGKEAPSRARKLVRENDILFATIRPTLQRIALVPNQLDQQVCSTGYFVLRVKPGIDHRFIFYLLFTERFMEQMARVQKGASYPAVTDGDVRAYPIPVPPLPEQRRIVALLDEAFAGLAVAQANAEKNLQNARALFESRLNEVFTRKGEGWVERRLGELCDFEGGSQPPKSQFVYLPRAGYVRFLQIRDFSSEKHVTFIPESRKNRLCREDDVMLGRYGASVGKILTGKAGAYNVALMKTIPNLAVVDRRFFYHYLISRVFQEPLGKVAARSAQNGFSKEDIFGFPVPVPPLSKQRKTTSRLDALAAETRKLENLYERKLAALGELKKSILRQAFNGEL